MIDQDSAIAVRESSSQEVHPQKTHTTPFPEGMAQAPDGLSNERLLALLLRTGGKKAGSVQEQSQRLLAAFGDLRGIGRAGLGELCSLEGITPQKAASLQAAFELGRRFLCVPYQRGQAFVSAEDVFRAYQAELSTSEQETFWVLLMNQRNRVLRTLQVAKGSINRCPITPQDVFAPALREKAVRMILMHNHPSGDPTPSLEDRSLTRRFQHIASLLGIEILDHIVFGEGRYVSFADEGWM